jgi:hypothetical protein
MIGELLADPVKFEEEGGPYKLLQEYFHGLSVDTLHPLLRSSNTSVQRAAAFIVSELGRRACALVDDMIPLIYSGNRYLAYQAMEVSLLCCVDETAENFAHVVGAMESDDGVLVALAMRLVARASAQQLQGAERFFISATAPHQGHKEGLSLLLKAHRVPAEVVAKMLDAGQPLERKYAAVAVGRSFRGVPALVDKVTSSDDLDVRKFAREIGSPNGSVGA